MTNALTKNFTVVIEDPPPVSTYRPAVPSFISYNPVHQCGWFVAGLPYHWVVPASPPGAPAEFVPVIPPSPNTSYQYVYTCVDSVMPIVTPAVPAGYILVPQPARVISSLDIGWDAGAWSNVRLPGNCYGQFVVTKAVGVVIGFSQTESKGVYSAISHALSFAAGVAKVMESGVNVMTSGAYIATDVWRIERIGTQVTYRKNGTAIYTSTVPSVGLLALDTSMFMTGDGVDQPVFAPMVAGDGGAAVRLPRLVGLGGLATYQFAVVSLPRLSANGGSYFGVHATLPKLRGISANFAYAEEVATLPRLTTFATGGLATPPYGVSSATMRTLSPTGHMLTGEIGEVIARPLPKLQAIADQGARIQARAVLPKLRALGYQFDAAHSGFVGSVMFAGHTLISNSFIVATMTEAGFITDVWFVGFAVLASQHDSLTITDEMLKAFTLIASMHDTLIVDSEEPGVRGGNQVWVVNTDTNASSRYEEFSFNSFARQGDNYYGARTDGVYQLGGDSDDGQPIMASANFGRLDMKMMAKKQVPNTYLGVSSTGVMVLRVTTEQGTFTYQARTSSSEMKVQRVDLGKGLRGNYYQFELLNDANGCDFDLDDIEFRVVETTRRIQ